MARRHVGTLSLGGMIALCAILLLAPEARSQIKVQRQMLTISGSIGLSGVTLQGLPNAVQTDDNGVYTAQVDYNFTGKVRPVKIGYTFQPAEVPYNKLTTNAQQDYVAERMKFTISGTVGMPGVTMNGFDTVVVSDASGRYTATVEYDWTGTVTPEKAGFRFEPASQSYANVTKNSQDSYKPSAVTYTISGSAIKPGIVMKGFPGTQIVTGADGTYKAVVPYEWSGTVEPNKPGCLFTPERIDYTKITSDQTNQNYDTKVLSYAISGSVGLPGVVLKGFPEEILSDALGFYMVSVDYGWSGEVVPDRPGYSFAPSSYKYNNVTKTYEDQNFTAAEVFLTIEGSTGTDGVTLTGFPNGPVTSNEKGLYSAQVPYDWTGTIFPDKEGWSFTPKQQEYTGVTANQTNQNFKADKVFFDISGNVQLGGVVLKVKDQSMTVTSRPDGSYTMKVDYNWSGTVIPTKSGYEFLPPETPYTNVLMPQLEQNYQARIMQHAISGKILDKKTNAPIADVEIVPEGTSPADSVMTDQDGSFEVKVDHMWRGKITARLAGWNFTPAVKPIDPVTTAISNLSILGEKKMLTISNVITFDDNTPIVDVKVSADPEEETVSGTTDSKGRFNVKVPYNWTGILKFDKPGFNIMDPTIYPNVTEDIDLTAPKKTVTPPQETTRPTTPVGSGSTTPPVGGDQTTRPVGGDQTTRPVGGDQTTRPDQISGGATITAQEAILRRLAQVKSEYDAVKTQPFSAANSAKMGELLQEQMQLEQMLPNLDGTQGGLTDINAASSAAKPKAEGGLKLLSVLGELGRRKNAQIYTDLTVKDEPTTVGVDSVANLSVEQALQQILDGTANKKYTFDVLPNDKYLVYYPLSTMYMSGSPITQAVADISQEVGVSIICDPNIIYNTTATFENVPLETALKRILAGTPYSFRQIDDYYLIGDSGPKSQSFHHLMVTSHVRLNNVTPTRMKDLLTDQYRQYVQAEAPNARDPNDQGHLLTVTAPQEITEKILEIVRSLDLRRRMVLLDARVVAMDNTNSLNLGVDWEFPTFQYGRVSTDGDWTKVFSIGYTADGGFTNALMAKLSALQSDNKLEILANPQITAQDGSQAELRSIREEWFMMSNTGENTIYTNSELEKIESGTILTITPYIGDSNDITLEFAVEVSNSIAKGTESELPIVTRRKARSRVTIQNGGTAALAGLTENRTRTIDARVPGLSKLPIIGSLFRSNDDEKATQEIAVFVTANLVSERSASATSGARGGSDTLAIGGQSRPAGQDFKNDLAKALANQ